MGSYEKFGNRASFVRKYLLFDAKVDTLGRIFVENHGSLFTKLFNNMLSVSLDQLSQQIFVSVLFLSPWIPKNGRLFHLPINVLITLTVSLTKRCNFRLWLALAFDP